MTIKRQILEFINEELELDINRDEVRELESKLNSDNDFYIDIDGNEYRFIHSDIIWDMYKKEIKYITEECYDINLASWMVMDWEETANNCFVDGYGHTFSGYDGGEIEYTFGEEDYYIFRIN